MMPYVVCGKVTMKSVAGKLKSLMRSQNAVMINSKLGDISYCRQCEKYNISNKLHYRYFISLFYIHFQKEK